jgi:hypothetical protein
MGTKILKCNITFANIPESKLKHFTRRDGTEDIGLNLSIVRMRNKDKFGNTHTIYVSQTKEEWERKEPKIFIGSGKVLDFKEYDAPNNNNDDDDIPF